MKKPQKQKVENECSTVIQHPGSKKIQKESTVNRNAIKKDNKKVNQLSDKLMLKQQGEIATS